MKYDVPLIPQQTGMSCWAAGIAMIVSWASNSTIGPDQIAKKGNYGAAYINGLNPNDSKILTSWGLIAEAPQTYTVSGFRQLLLNYGPLWVAAAVPGPHIRVVAGFVSHANPAKAKVFVNDPWEKGNDDLPLAEQGRSVH